MKRAIIFIITVVFLLGTLSACDGKLSLEQVKETLLSRYPNDIFPLTLEEGDEPRLQVTLDINSPRSAKIKDTLERYGSRVVIKYDSAEMGTSWMPSAIKQTNRSNALRYGLEGVCELTRLGDVSAARTRALPPDEALIEETINRFLENHPAIQKSDKQVVEEGDLLKVSYRIYDEKEVYYDIPQETVKCGAEGFDETVVKSVPGRKVGDKYTVKMTKTYQQWGVPEDALCDVEILFIYNLADTVLNDAYVKDNTKYASVQEWKDALRAEQEKAKKEEAWDAAMGKLIADSVFAFSEDKFAERTAKIVFDSQQQAKRLGLSEKEFFAIKCGRKVSIEEYISNIYESAKKEIYEILLVYAIAEQEKITVGSSEISDALTARGLKKSEASETEIKLMQYSLLREKVADYMVISGG